MYPAEDTRICTLSFHKACAYQIFVVFDRNKVEAMTGDYNSPTFG